MGPIDVKKHAYIYAGAQKNLGPAGICIDIICPVFADGKNELPICPTYCSWKTMADNDSMYNTPACWTLYAIGEYLKFMKKAGGLTHWAELSDKKSGLIYNAVDDSDGFYQCPVVKSARSRMNLPFTIMGGNEELEKKFMDSAKKEKLFTLAGHRPPSATPRSSAEFAPSCTGKALLCRVCKEQFWTPSVPAWQCLQASLHVCGL